VGERSRDLGKKTSCPGVTGVRYNEKIGGHAERSSTASVDVKERERQKNQKDAKEEP